MADASKLTLKTLRELARKHLGAGQSALKTKAQLLSALKRWLPRAPAAKAAKPAKPAPKEVAREKKPAPKRERSAAPKASRSKAPPPAEPTAAAAEPIVEGFFVARVVSEKEARAHGLTEERATPVFDARPAGGYDEHLGELPGGYGDDAFVLLPRDPHTLFVFWDFDEGTRRAAAAGLDAPRAVLRICEGERVVRELDFALESKSFYVHGLPPGGQYRAEAFFVGKDGRAQRIGHASHVIELPRLGPSPDTSVRFLRLPWGLRLSELWRELRAGKGAFRKGGEEPRAMLWRRIPLPGSGGFREEWETFGLSSRGQGASERHARR